MSIWLWREQLNDSAMFLFYLFPRVPLTLPDPPWPIFLPWTSLVVRRILMHRVIVSLISAPCRARGSATMVRRTLVTSLEFSHHDRRAILVFARVKMCGHLPLIHSIKCSSGETTDFFPMVSQPPRNRLDIWASFWQAAFSLPWCHFYQQADMTQSMMTFGLVGIWTPFNTKKS